MEMQILIPIPPKSQTPTSFKDMSLVVALLLSSTGTQLQCVVVFYSQLFKLTTRSMITITNWTDDHRVICHSSLI